MKTKIYKIFGVALALVLVFSLAGAFIPVNRAEAQAYTPNQWNTMDTPDPAPPFKIVTGSNVTDIAVAADGKTIYAVDNTASLADGLKSIFGGGIWSPMPTLTTAINFTTGTAKLVAVAPDDPNVVAVVATGAANDAIFYSTSGGATWAYMGETALATEIITDIAISPTRLGPLLGRDIVVCTSETRSWAVTADSFTISATAADAASTITVTAGAVLATPAVTATVAGGTVPVTITAGPIALGFAAAGDSILFQALTAGTTGTWAQGVATTTAAVTTNTSGLAAVVAAGGAFTLPGAGAFGDVYLVPGAIWTPAATTATPALPGMDFTSLALATNWAGDRVVVAVGSNALSAATDTNDTDTTAPFGDTYLSLIEVAALDLSPPGPPEVVPPTPVLMEATGRDSPPEMVGPGTTGIVSSSLALPMDFDSTTVTGRRSFIGWTSVSPTAYADDAWRVDNLSVRKLEIAAQVSIYSVSYFGTISSGTLFAAETQGSAATAPALIWYSQDPQSAIPTWTYSFKPPTGNLGGVGPANVVVAAAPDFDTSLMVYAGTSGADSGFSRSPNGGVSYNQIGLIDMAFPITLQDAMPTPDSSVIFLATEVGGNHSLWKSNTKPSGSSWERIRSKPAAGSKPFTTVPSIIRLSPEYDTDFALYWCDTGWAGPDGLMGTGDDVPSSGIIERSVDGGDVFATRTAPVAIQDIAVENKDILYMGDFASSQVRRSSNGGWFFDLPIDAQVAFVYSLAMCPAYPEKPVAGNLAVGGTSSSAMTKNSAASFFPLSASIGGGTNLQILADVDYANNNTLYAGSNTLGHGIWRYEVGVSTAWEQIRPVGTTQQMTGLAMQAGYLYGSWFDTVGTPSATGADSFTILDPTLAGEAGTVSCTGGSVLLTPTAASNAGAGVGVAVTLVAGQSAVITIAATAGENILVSAVVANSAGAWTRAANAVAGITTDLDGDASVAVLSGAFSLPDVVAAATGVALGGAERSLVPAIPVIANWLFDTMDKGSAAATFSTVPSALRVGATETAATLWSINTTAKALLAYDDEMAKAKLEVTLPDTVPIDPVSGRSSEFIISWAAISNATTFEVEIHSDPACSQLVVESQTAGLATGWYTPSNPLAPAWVVRADTLVAGRDYFVRIRVRDQMPEDKIRSGWSSVYRFSVAGGERVQVTYLGPQPLGPAPGAINVPIDGPGFTWSPYAQSTRYEFQLANDSGFTDIVAETKTSATGYKYDGKLSNATTYFWRVRGIEPTTSDWSPVASFATEKKPVPPVVVEPTPIPPTPEPLVTPAIIWAIIAIGAILVIAVIVLIVRTRRVS